ncbi:hypothetical protein ACFSKR_31445 [Kitasatospora cinereorecta]
MTVFEPTEQARAAAVRAAALADIARRRTLVASAWNGRELINVAELLDIVTLSLYEEEPTRPGGSARAPGSPWPTPRSPPPRLRAPASRWASGSTSRTPWTAVR